MDMNVDFVVANLGNLFSVGLKIALPLLLATLAVGLLVSIFQVVTQIQEMTLTFVPKIIIAVAVLGMLGPWMLGTLIDFSINTISQISNF